jgi:hypothetical protein
MHEEAAAAMAVTRHRRIYHVTASAVRQVTDAQAHDLLAKLRYRVVASMVLRDGTPIANISLTLSNNQRGAVVTAALTRRDQALAALDLQALAAIAQSAAVCLAQSFWVSTTVTLDGVCIHDVINQVQCEPCPA